MNYKRLIIIGFFLVLAGAILPFLMVMGYIQTTFLTSILAYTVSVGGLFLGVLGSAMYVGKVRGRDDSFDL